MKQLLIFCTVLLLTLNLCLLEARGGRGGGGRGGGRAGGGAARSVQRSSSMSRTSRPASATRPQASRQNVASRAATRAPSTQARRDVQQFMNHQPARTATARGNLQTQTAVPIGNRGQRTRSAQFQNIGNNVRNTIGNRYPNRSSWFNQNFWDNHNIRPAFYGNPANWWAAATALGVGTWLGWQSSPYYYTYDEFGDESFPSYYLDGSDSSYTEQTESIAAAASTSTNNEWMPLGVFSIAKESGNATSPNMFVQLALNKDGEIAGTFYNTTTNQTYALEGLVDQNSQRAAWKIVGNSSSPIIETGLYNLTQEEAPVRIYFPNSTSQDRLLVRVEV